MEYLVGVHQHRSISLLAQIVAQMTTHYPAMWIVGGALRNALLGLPVHDIDIIVPGDPVALAHEVAQIPGASVAIMHRDADVARLTFTEIDYSLDLARMKGTSIEDDLQQRDFTINALAVPLSVQHITAVLDGNLSFLRTEMLDPMSGIPDLQQRVLRCVSTETFIDDPIRILRAARIAAQCECTIDADTLALAYRSLPALLQCASSRILSELFTMLSLHRKGRAALRHLDALGVLHVLIPELDPCRGQRQGELHYFDVFEHTLAVVDELDHLVELLQLGLELPPDSVSEFHRAPAWKPVKHFDNTHQVEHPVALDLGDLNQTLLTYLQASFTEGHSRLTLLKTAAIFHDIGKPATKVEYAAGRFTFPKHAEAGAPITHTILLRWKIGKTAAHYITSAVRYHMHPGRLASHLLPMDEVRRFFHEADNVALDVLLFSLADHLAVYGPMPLTPFWPLHYSAVSHLVQQYLMNPDVVQPPRLISGNDVMMRYNLTAGPHLREYLTFAYDLQLAGIAETRAEIWERLDPFAAEILRDV